MFSVHVCNTPNPLTLYIVPMLACGGEDTRIHLFTEIEDKVRGCVQLHRCTYSLYCIA